MTTQEHKERALHLIRKLVVELETWEPEMIEVLRATPEAKLLREWIKAAPRPTGEVTVTQEAREAAAAMIAIQGGRPTMPSYVRMGQEDDHPVVQAFAQAEARGEQREREAVAKLSKVIAASALQTACETDPADPEHPDTVMLRTGDLETIVRLAVENECELAALTPKDQPQ